MADYYPLLSKAVAGLEANTPEARSAVYERARAALSRQMAGMDPPVPPAIVERELAALAAVIERIEGENRAPAAAGFDAPGIGPDIVRAGSDDGARPARDRVRPEPVVQSRPQVARREAKRDRRPWAAVGAAVGLMVVMAVATLAFLRRNEPPAVATRPNPAATRPAEASATPPKTGDRVGASGQETPTRPAAPPPQAAVPRPAEPARPAEAPTSASPAPAPPATTQVAVANRMMLVLEGREEPQKVEVRPGSVVWRTETVSGGQGQALQVAIRGVVDVPESRLRAEITIQRNRDPAFPASHTIQIQFSSLGASELGPIQNLSQIEMRQTENQPGYALAGQGIAVMQDLFLVALAQIEPAQTRNVEMLRSRPLMYLEFQAVGGRRGAMIIEKGVSGQQAFDEALRNWQ